MKKIILLLLMTFIFSGCGISNTAKSPVEDYLSSYNNLEYEVLLDMEKVIEEENLTDNQSSLYRDILKKQYQDLKYEVISESYDEDEALVKVKIKVYDYYKSEKNSAEYLNENRDEFNDENGLYDVNKYMDYKLNELKKVTDTVEYTLEFEVINENDIWKLNTISQSNLEKIHGIYNYEE